MVKNQNKKVKKWTKKEMSKMSILIFMLVFLQKIPGTVTMNVFKYSEFSVDN